MQLDELTDETNAHRVLRRAVHLGVDHIDTASFYGDGSVNRLIRSALWPYPVGLGLVSKVGARYSADTRIPLVPAQHPDELRAQVEADLQNLGVENLTAVNLRRVDGPPGIIADGNDVVPMEDQLAELIALREEGKIGGVGLSNVDADQLRAALPAGVVCVQNAYSLLDRGSEGLLEICHEHDIAWVPFCPLGSALAKLPSTTKHPVVQEVAAQAGATPAQVSLAWLLARDDNTLLIPGTSSVEHLEENLAAGDVHLTSDAMTALDHVAATSTSPT